MPIDVSGTSAVGMAQRSSRSIVVGVVGELGQLAGGGERAAEHQAGRPDLLVGVGVAVEGELAERAAQRGAGAAEHREHRAGDLGAALEVEDAELGPDVPVRHPLVSAVRRRDRSPRPAARRCRLVAAVRARRRPACWGCAAAGRAARRPTAVASASSACSCSPRSRLSACSFSASSTRPSRRRPPTSLDSWLIAARISSRSAARPTLAGVERPGLLEGGRQIRRRGGRARRPPRRSPTAAGARRAWVQGTKGRPAGPTGL